MSQFSQLIDELHRGQPSPARAEPRRTQPSEPVTYTPAPLPRRLPDRQFAKAMDVQLSQSEARIRGVARQIREGAVESSRADVADIRARAAELISRKNADVLKAIGAGQITAQEVAERQILLDAFARHMGLS